MQKSTTDQTTQAILKKLNMEIHHNVIVKQEGEVIFHYKGDPKMRFYVVYDIKPGSMLSTVLNHETVKAIFAPKTSFYNELAAPKENTFFYPDCPEFEEDGTRVSLVRLIDPPEVPR